MQSYVLAIICLSGLSAQAQINICEEALISLKSNPFRGTLFWEISQDGMEWTVIGSTTDTIFTTSIQQAGDFTIRGKIIEGTCEPVFTNIQQISIAPLPPLTSFIHPDSIYMDLTFANLEIDGDPTGIFSILSGLDGQLESGFNPNIIILEGQLGQSYQVEYKLTNDCGYRADTVNIAFCSDTLRANAGADQILKAGTNIVLQPVIQTPYDIGSWSLISGTPGSFSTNQQGDPIFQGQSMQAYSLLWTVTNGCGIFYDTLLVSFSSCPSDSITFQLGNETVTYGLIPGSFNNGQYCWMDRNLGAQRKAQSFNDNQSYGFYYQWGRLHDGHQVSNSPSITTLSPVDNPGTNRFIRANDQPYDWRIPQNNTLWQAPGLVNNPCPEGWRVPTREELINESSTWTPQNRTGAFNSPLRMSAAGFRSQGASMGSVGTSGNYWSSSPANPSSFYLTFGEFSVATFGELRAVGLPIRCIKQ